MKLSKKDRAKLENILNDLKRGIAFVMSENTALMRKHTLGSIDYFESQFPPYLGQKWSPIEKQIGNEFVIAVSATQRLEYLLNQNGGDKTV